MPLYEYRCDKCRVEFELLVRESDIPSCPTCQSTKVEKLLSVSASPNVNSAQRDLPMVGESCAAPRCCGGGCQI